MASFNYKNTYDNFLQDGDFLHRVEVAGVVAAQQVYAESAQIAGHTVRAAYATEVLNQSAGFAYRFAAVVVTDAANIAAGVKNISDADLLRPILAAWNSLAGV